MAKPEREIKKEDEVRKEEIKKDENPNNIIPSLNDQIVKER